MKKLVIIPVYNEGENIIKVINDINNNSSGFDYIIINDSSTDNTTKIIEMSNYNEINLPINLGIGGAVQTGYMYALQNDYDIAVQFDGDGQHNAKYLNIMFEYMMINNLDMVIGSRFINHEGYQSSFSRRIGIRYFSWLINKFTNVKIKDPTSGLRMVNRKVINLFCNYYPQDYPEPESTVTLTRHKFNIGEISVVMNERTEGRSSINLIKSFYYMVKVSLAVLIDLLKEENRR